MLFGGSTLAGTSFGDTWEWDGTDWTQVEDTGPDARAGHALAYDSNRSRIVLFGGAAADGTPMGDTWEWDGTSWTQVEDTGPDSRSEMQIAFDAKATNCVLFGGLAAANALRSDTWLWDGTKWTQAQDTGPSARRAHVQAHDSVRSEVVLFGGDNGSGAVGDTWAWDGTVWTQRAHFGPPPSASAALVFDGSVALLYGGVASLTDPNAKVFAGTWQWDGAHWTERQDIGPGSRSSVAMAFDAARGCAVLYGGVAVPPASSTASSHLLGDTWEEQGSGPPVQLTALTVNPATVAAGDATTIEADLSHRAPAGGAVVVVTATGAAGVPNVEVPGGATSASATYTVPADTPPGDATLTGQLAGSSQTATLHVTGAGGSATMAAFTITPSTMQSSQGASLVFQVDLTGPASQGGVVAAVSYQGNSMGTISIAAGSTSGSMTLSLGRGARRAVPVRRNPWRPNTLGDADVGLVPVEARDLARPPRPGAGFDRTRRRSAHARLGLAIPLRTRSGALRRRREASSPRQPSVFALFRLPRGRPRLLISRPLETNCFASDSDRSSSTLFRRPSANVRVMVTA